MSENKELATARRRSAEIKESKTEKDWRRRAKKQIEFFCGDQGWDGAKAKLAREGRPALTLNRIAPILRLMMGARPRIEARCSAAEDGDVETADILNSCKDHVERVNSWEFYEDEWFKLGVLLNRSVVTVDRSYSRDARGEISIEVMDPFEYYFGESKRKDRADMTDFFREYWIGQAEAKRLYPDMSDEIESFVGRCTGGWSDGSESREYGGGDEYADPEAESAYFDSDSKKICVRQYWWKEAKSITKIVDLASVDGDTEIIEVPGKSVRQVEAEILREFPSAADRFKVVSTDYTEIQFIVFCGDVELERGAHPWDRDDGRKTDLSESFNIIVFEPERIYNGAGQELISLIDPLMDPQKFHNKLASAILHIIGTTANSGWEYEKSAISRKERKKLKNYGSKPGINIEWEDGALAGGKARKIQPSYPPQAHMAEAKNMANAMLDISGVESLVSTESLGKGASGKAIDLKQRQGGNIISWIYDSFRFFQHQLVKFIRDGIQATYDYEKVIRIRGHKDRYVTINETIYDEYGAITEVLNNISIGVYDVILQDRDVLPTQRLERFREFAELVKSGALQLPSEVLTKIVIELMDDPDLKQMIEEELNQLAQQAQQLQAMQAMQSLSGGAN